MRTIFGNGPAGREGRRASDPEILHRARSRPVGQRTALINQLRAVLLERGIVVGKGRRQLETFLVTMRADGAEPPTL